MCCAVFISLHCDNSPIKPLIARGSRSSVMYCISFCCQANCFVFSTRPTAAGCTKSRNEHSFYNKLVTVAFIREMRYKSLSQLIIGREVFYATEDTHTHIQIYRARNRKITGILFIYFRFPTST